MTEIEKKQPWQHYNRRKEEEMTTKEVVDALIALYDKHKGVGVAAMIIFLTNSRCREVLRYKYVWVKNEDKRTDGSKLPMTKRRRDELIEGGKGRTVEYTSIRFKDFRYELTRDYKIYLHIRTRVEKGKNPTKTHYKEAVLRMQSNYEDLSEEKQKFYMPLIMKIDKYLKDMGWGNFNNGYVENSDEILNTSETPLFTFSDSFLRKKLMDNCALTPHMLRGFMSKFLVTELGFNVQQLMLWTQWVSTDIAINIYSRSNLQNIKDTIDKNFED